MSSFIGIDNETERHESREMKYDDDGKDDHDEDHHHHLESRWW